MPKRQLPFLLAAAIAVMGAAGGTLLAPAFAQSLPNGAGKEVVEKICTACHDLEPITSSGFDRRDWETVVQSMIDMGAVISPQEVQVITTYLAANFPPRAQK